MSPLNCSNSLSNLNEIGLTWAVRIECSGIKVEPTLVIARHTESESSSGWSLEVSTHHGSISVVTKFPVLERGVLQLLNQVSTSISHVVRVYIAFT